MASWRYIQLEFLGPADRIGLITLNRSEKANAYHTPMLDELEQALEQATDPKTKGALIITGAGKRAFCAGADLNELSGRDHHGALDLLSRKLFNRIAQTPIPTIAAIHGAAFAGGLELALACDLRVGAPTARFALPETRLGLIPAAGGVHRLSQAIGMPRAKQMTLFAEEIDANTALNWGLVARVSDDPVAAAVLYAEAACANDPLANRIAKLNMDSDQDSLESISQALLYHRRKDQGEPR